MANKKKKFIMDSENKTFNAVEKISIMWLNKIWLIIASISSSIADISLSSLGITNETHNKVFNKLERIRSLIHSLFGFKQDYFNYNNNCIYEYKKLYNYLRMHVIIVHYYCKLLIVNVNKTSENYNHLIEEIRVFNNAVVTIFDPSVGNHYRCDISKLNKIISYSVNTLNKCDNKKMKMNSIIDYDLIKYIINNVHADDDYDTNIYIDNSNPYDFSSIKIDNDDYNSNRMFNDDEQSIDLTKFY